MNIKRIASIIGYSYSTLRKYVRKGHLFAILQDRKYLVSKYSPINLLASDNGFAMQPKSEWHEKAIRWFIKEMPHTEETDLSFFDYIHSNISSKEISRICSYLTKGTIIISCCGTSSDIIDESKGIAGVPSMITDGTWLWPGDLVHYVKNYHLKLSEAFIEHMKANSWDVNVDEESLGSQVIVTQ